MIIRATKNDFQHLVNASFTALANQGFKVKRSILQDKIAELLTEGQRKYSSLMADYPQVGAKNFDFNSFEDNRPRGFDLDWFKTIHPVLSEFQPYRHPIVCVTGDMRPQRILESKEHYRLDHFTGSFNRQDLGLFFQTLDDFTGEEIAFAIFDFKRNEIEGEPCVTFMLQTGKYENVVQIKDCVEWIGANGRIERTDSHLKANNNLWPAFSEQFKDSPQPADDLIPYNEICDALDGILEREDPLVIPETAEEQIPKHIKIEAAKSFSDLHKSPVFSLVAYEEGESVPEDVWLEIWDYIWEHLEADSGEEPYIELSQFETKSGHTEIFNVNYIETQFLWQCDQYDIREWTTQGILNAFDLTEDELLANPNSGDVQTAKEWAEEFAAHRDDPLCMPDQFFILTENEVDFNPSFESQSIAGHIRIWPKGEWLDESFETEVTTDAIDDNNDLEEVNEYLRLAYQEGQEWLKEQLDSLDYLSEKQKREATNNFKSELVFWLNNSTVAQIAPVGLMFEQEDDANKADEMESLKITNYEIQDFNDRFTEEPELGAIQVQVEFELGGIDTIAIMQPTATMDMGAVSSKLGVYNESPMMSDLDEKYTDTDEELFFELNDALAAHVQKAFDDYVTSHYEKEEYANGMDGSSESNKLKRI